MTRKFPEPETKIIPRICNLGVRSEASTRRLRAPRIRLSARPVGAGEPLTQAMPASLLANLLDADPTASTAARPSSCAAGAADRSHPADPPRRTQAPVLNATVVALQCAEPHAAGAHHMNDAAPRELEPRSFRRVQLWLTSRTCVLAASACVIALGLWLIANNVTNTTYPQAHASVQPVTASPKSSTKNPEAARPAAKPSFEAARMGSRANTAQAPSTTPAPPSVQAAIERLASGHYTEALAAYRALAQAMPAQPAYAAVVAILERRLATQCPGRNTSQAASCLQD